jgi:hypothetical protein
MGNRMEQQLPSCQVVENTSPAGVVGCESKHPNSYCLDFVDVSLFKKYGVGRGEVLE